MCELSNDVKFKLFTIFFAYIVDKNSLVQITFYYTIYSFTELKHIN